VVQPNFKFLKINLVSKFFQNKIKKSPTMVGERGTNMQQYFKELTRVYKNFKKEENQLNADFQSAKESGRYNHQYLRELSNENQQKLSALRKSANARFDAIRADLEKELNATNSINGGFLSDALVKLLTSPIRLTADEYSELARRHADSATNSRLLHDAAARDGYTLENYTSTVDIISKFDTAVERLQKSMFQSNGSLPFYTSETDAERGTGQLCGQAINRTFACYETPKTLEQHIVHDAAVAAAESDKVATVNGAEFVQGFTGAKPTNDVAAILTPQEKADATARSIADGRNGVIDQSDVSYVRGDAGYIASRD
jgi:hypothetical protein